MKAIFFNPKQTNHPSFVFGIILPALVRRQVLRAVFLAVLAAATFMVVIDWPPILAASIGAGLVFVGAVLMGLMGTLHEVTHVFVGSRLVSREYPRAFVMPTFKHPFVRFDAPDSDVALSDVALILLSGPVAGLLVAALILIAVLNMPDWWGLRWMWLSYWGGITFSQVVSLIPTGETDGHKVRQLMRERSITWFDIGRATRRLLRGTRVAVK